ncbi:MAG: DUF4911 domain-containing protein [Bilophila sp.]
MPECSDKLLVTLPPQQVGMFRFLLEGYDNIASFTVLDRSEALLKVFFSPHQHGEARSPSSKTSAARSTFGSARGLCCNETLH